MFGSTPLQPNRYPTAGARSCVRNASSTASLIRYLRHTRDRSRVEADLAVARSASSIATPSQQRFAPRRGARDRPAWSAGGSRAALRAAEAIPPAELRGTGVSPGDSASFRAFARLPMGWTPKKAVLQKTISAITAASLGKRSIRRWCATPGKPGSSRRRWFSSIARSLKR